MSGDGRCASLRKDVPPLRYVGFITGRSPGGVDALRQRETRRLGGLRAAEEIPDCVNGAILVLVIMRTRDRQASAPARRSKLRWRSKVSFLRRCPCDGCDQRTGQAATPARTTPATRPISNATGTNAWLHHACRTEGQEPLARLLHYNILNWGVWIVGCVTENFLDCCKNSSVQAEPLCRLPMRSEYSCPRRGPEARSAANASCASPAYMAKGVMGMGSPDNCRKADGSYQALSRG